MFEKVSLGCDPEFGLIRNGGIVSASSVISGTEFGVDGCGRVAELRPNYAWTAKDLVNNIREVLRYGYKNTAAIRDCVWKAGGMACDEPIGGHIHFGCAALKKNDVATKFAGALNKTLAVLCLMVEDQEEALNRRIGTSYGQVDSGEPYRAQSHGVEYRVLGSWLTAPDEALAILSLAHLISKHHDDDDVMDEANDLPAFESRAFKTCDKIGLLYYLKPIVKFIRSLKGFDQHEEEIAPLLRLIKNQKIWSCHKNMIVTWGLAEEEKKEKKEVTGVKKGVASYV